MGDLSRVCRATNSWGMIFVRRIHGGEHSVHVLGGLVAFQRPLRSGGTLQSWLRCAELAPRTQVFEQESFASKL